MTDAQHDAIQHDVIQHDTLQHDTLQHDTLQDDAGRLVERWFFEAFHGSPAARTTEVWNHVHAAKDELKRRLAAFLADL